MTEWLLDGLLVIALVITAVAALLSRDLFRAVVVFIAFGLLMTVAWVRLQAPDIALAEAAIGAGLTGVLLLDAVSHLGSKRPGKRTQEGGEQ
ncbi:hydrogenase subunit MbhD domain-containing protein [Marinobacter sp. HL-58]|uniref:Na(+)/H(+) antiporter subunit B n=1 Tax=Marinobacter sp. HL-58 TaxID=1479237 RepID=UPI0004828CE7|nr:hydrogenase subunit MbhD domain-containing protein [Marinobacter sp. HL-58]KPQ03206.1 MAG: putative subunit of the Multisubunit Na+/H+ antiporter [Marinobacter sp. HL-58]